MSAPTTPDYQPAGYCPHCGYAMDAGTCPECGREVPRAELAKVPPQVAFRRMVRWLVAVALVLGVSGGVYYVVASGVWIRWVPNSFLLDYMQSDWEAAQFEIVRRCTVGRFDQQELKYVRDNSLEFGADFAPRVPARHPIPMQLWIRPYGPLSTHYTSGNRFYIPMFRDWTVSVDGEPVLQFEKPGWVSGDPTGTMWRTVVLPGLESGHHGVRITGRYHNWRPAHFIFPSPYLREFDTVFPITVEDRPMSDFVALKWSSELAEEMRKNVRITCAAEGTATNYPPQIAFSVYPLPVHLACRVFIRVPGTDTYYEMCYDPNIPSSFFSEPDQVDWHTNGTLRLPDSIEEPNAIDIQLRPYPAAALSRGWDECFGGVLEWTACPLKDPSWWFPISEAEPATRVFKCEPDPNAQP